MNLGWRLFWGTLVVLLGAAWLSSRHGDQDRRQLAQLLARDSAARAAWAAERAASDSQLAKLRADSAQLAQLLKGATQASRNALRSVDRLLAELAAAGHTAQVDTLRDAVALVAAPVAACTLALDNCEQRAAVLRLQVRQDSVELVRRVGVQDSLANGWRRADARAGKACGLGGTAGWGGQWNASLGVTCLFVRGFKLPWPF